MNVLHGLTGSIATVLVDKIEQAYQEKDTPVSFVSTKSANIFCKEKQIHPSQKLIVPGRIHDDLCEWDWYKKERRVLHIDLVKWADVLVIAPCSANTMAKLANGICDNLLTCIARAWDFDKRVIIAPAMNTKMWTHPITQEHITKLKSWGIEIIDPVEKTLYCGDTGIGAMANIDEIINRVLIS